MLKFLLFFFLIQISANEVKTIRLVSSLPKTSALYRYALAINQLVFKGIKDYKVEIVNFPTERAELQLSTDPTLVGDFGRLEAFGTRHPELVKVRIPIKKVPIVCIVRIDSPISGCDAESLKGVRIASLKGSAAINQMLQDQKLKASQLFSDTEQGMQQLLKKRIDAILVIGHEMLSEKRGMHAGKYKIAGEHNLSDAFMFIKPGYPDLIDKLQKRMNELEKSGEFLKLHDQMFPVFQVQVK